MGKCLSVDKPKSSEKKSTNDSLGFSKEINSIIKHKNIQDFYNIETVMGRGHFGTVKRARSKDSHDTNGYAIKSILKEKIESHLELLERELGLLMSVDHPNIIKFYEVYEDTHYIHIVMELCSGGELFDQLISKGRYTEAEAAKVMHSLFSAVAHLHSLEIAHRDLKPENIMLSTNSEDSEIKIIDFGLAKKYLFEEEGKNTIIGSSYYVAPEVLSNKYGLSCDIWSLGVILFMLLSGKPPFDGTSDMTIYNQIMKSSYSTDGPEWTKISSDGKDFVKLLLNPDYKHRITAKEALEHPWLETRRHPVTAKVERKVMKRLKQHIHSNKIVRETMNVLIKTMKKDEITQLNEVFKELDQDHTGFISVNQLQQGLISAGIDLEGQELKDLLDSARDSTGKLQYSDFLAMTIDMKHLENTDELWLAFKYFDIENQGYITKDNFYKTLKKAGWKLTEDEVSDMIHEFGIEDFEKMQFGQFCEMFRDTNHVEKLKRMRTLR